MDSDRKTHGKPGGGSLAGTLYFEDGEAAVDAQVMGFPVDHIPDTSSRHGSTAGSVFVARTDAQGRYSLDSVSEGYYSIIGESDGKVSYQDSVYVSASGAHSADTLQPPESLSGVVSLQPNHSTLSATVQILGTNAYANVGADGRFRIGGLAGGSYRIRVVSTIGEYTPLYASLRTAAAQDDSLSDTLRVPYTGIPVVTGLAYAYDTARGIVSLSWSPVDYPMLGTYVVLRDSAGALEPTERALALSPGPAFADTLLLPSRTGLFTDADTLDRPLEYRIKVRNKSNQTGLSYGTLRVDAVPPHRVRTSIALRLASVRWDSAEAADSIVIIATLGNPGRGLAGVQWAVGSRPDTTATRPLRGARSAVDTLRFGWSGQGPFTVHVFVRDEAGILREDSLRIPGNTAPTVQADPADSAWAGRKYQVVLRVSDPDGDTLRVLADNLPRWLSYSPAAKAFSGTPGSADTGTTEEIRVRITDGRRWDSLPAFRIRVLLPKGEPWTVRPSQLPDGRSFGALPAYSDGRIYAFMWSGNQMVRHVYHTGSRTWEASPVFPMPGWRSVRTIHILGEEAFLFGHTDGTSLSIDNRFDLRTGEVSPLPPRQHVRGWFASVAHGGRFYVIGGRGGDPADSRVMERYDPGTRSWETLAPIPMDCSDCRAGVAGGRIHVLASLPSAPGGIAMRIYDPSENAWSDAPSLPGSFSDFSVCGSGDRIYAMGGESGGVTIRSVYQYEPGSRAWSRKADMPYGMSKHFCAEGEGEIYLLGIPAAATMLVYTPAFE